MRERASESPLSQSQGAKRKKQLESNWVCQLGFLNIRGLSEGRGGTTWEDIHSFHSERSKGQQATVLLAQAVFLFLIPLFSFRELLVNLDSFSVKIGSKN